MHSHRGGAAPAAVVGAVMLLVSACASTPQQAEYEAEGLSNAHAADDVAQPREARIRPSPPVAAQAPQTADADLGEHALGAHRQAQQARDTALAAQLAAEGGRQPRSLAVSELVAELAALEVEAESTARGLVLVLDEPPGENRQLAAKLAPVIVFLERNPDHSVVVEGHTDNRLPLPESLRRSQADARAVRALLLREGVEARRVQAHGIGPDAPVADNDTAAGRARNRRLEVIIVPTKPIHERSTETR